MFTAIEKLINAPPGAGILLQRQLPLQAFTKNKNNFNTRLYKLLYPQKEKL